jgi:L-fuculose-phosphate aldolase
MSVQHAELREQIVEATRALEAAGMMPNESGNVSCRVPGGYVITPSGVPYDVLTPDQLVELRDDGSAEPDSLRPSSEWLMHAAIYSRRPEVQAIVHTHSPKATALSCAEEGIPAFHYMIALAGGAVQCAPYATFGSAELAANALRGLEGRRAVLLANHGVVTVGASLTGATAVATEVENLASQYLALRAAGLVPIEIEEDELARVIAKFVDYGRIEGPVEED